MRISDWSSDVCSSDLTCQILCAKELAGRRRAIAVRLRARREQQAAQKVALPLGALQEGGLLLGREPGKENMQILGHVEDQVAGALAPLLQRSEEHTSELQSLMRISYAVFCLKKK